MEKSQFGWNTPMDLSESSIHSFIIRIWLEETPEEARRAKWRGRITHVSSGTEGYFEDFGEIAPFVAACLGQSLTGIRQEARKKAGLWQRLRDWGRKG